MTNKNNSKGQAGILVLFLIIIVILIGIGIYFVARGNNIDILTSPSTARAGDSFLVSWQINGSGTISNTYVNYGLASISDNIEDSNYGFNSTVLCLTGTCSAPSSFSTNIRINNPGTYYYRVYATLDGDLIWSEEESIVITASNITNQTNTTGVPDFSQLGFSNLLTLREIPSNQSNEIDFGPYNLVIPVNTFDDTVIFRLYNASSINPPVNEEIVLGFAFRITDPMGNLIDDFNSPIILNIENDNIGSNSKLYNYQSNGNYVQNTNFQRSGDSIIHTINSARTAWVITNPRNQTNGSMVVDTRNTNLGSTLTNTNGRTLYVFESDPINSSSCYGGCANVWIPLTISQGQVPVGDDVTGNLGVFRRSDGTYQVTINNRALYTYTGDTSAGTTNGQRVNNFGGVWYAVSPSGQRIT